MHASVPGASGSYILELGDPKVPISTLTSHNFIPNNGVLLHRTVLDEVGLFDPHVLMTRLCDWDLWRRLSAAIDFRAVRVQVGEEFGPLLSDSLGVTHAMDLYAIEEWCRRPARCARLRPDQLLDVDVTAIPPDVSPHLALAISECVAQFRDKWWSASEQVRLDGRRILVVAPQIDATLTLHFEGLEEDVSRALRVVQLGVWSPLEVAEASMVILVRELRKSVLHGWIDRCQALGVPAYLFLDSNPFERAQDDPSFRWWAGDRAQALLSSLAGVLLATPELVDFFRANSLHTDLHLLSPITPRLALPTRDRDGLRILFMGCPDCWRPFLEHVAPAIRKVSSELPVDLLAFGLEDEEIRKAVGDKVSLSCQPHDVPFLRVLHVAAQFAPDVLVDPSSGARDGKDQTGFAAICAAAVDAVPILAAPPPGPGRAPPLDGALFCNLDWTEWHESLLRVAASSAERTRVSAANRAFCLDHFSGATNSVLLRELALREPFLGPSLMRKRGYGAANMPSGRRGLKRLLVTKLRRSIIATRVWSRVRDTTFGARIRRLLSY
jgi:hypothetical protein